MANNIASKFKVGTTTYEIKDATARQALTNLTNTVKGRSIIFESNLPNEGSITYNPAADGGNGVTVNKNKLVLTNGTKNMSYSPYNVNSEADNADVTFNLADFFNKSLKLTLKNSDNNNSQSTIFSLFGENSEVEKIIDLKDLIPVVTDTTGQQVDADTLKSYVSKSDFNTELNNNQSFISIKNNLEQFTETYLDSDDINEFLKNKKILDNNGDYTTFEDYLKNKNILNGSGIYVTTENYLKNKNILDDDGNYLLETSIQSYLKTKNILDSKGNYNIQNSIKNYLIEKEILDNNEKYSIDLLIEKYLKEKEILNNDGVYTTFENYLKNKNILDNNGNYIQTSRSFSILQENFCYLNIVGNEIIIIFNIPYTENYNNISVLTNANNLNFKLPYSDDNNRDYTPSRVSATINDFQVSFKLFFNENTFPETVFGYQVIQFSNSPEFEVSYN